MVDCKMAINLIRGTSDSISQRVAEVLALYQAEHSQAQIDLYRQNSVSVRVRVIDPDFRSLSRSDRHELIWQYFQPLTEEEQADISMLVLLTPDETAKSMANLEFEDPVPSVL